MNVMGITVVTIGLFLISGILKFEFNLGDLLTLFCAVAFALQIICINKYTKIGEFSAIAIVQLWTVEILASFVNT